jgi:hypothetical protein
MGILSAISNGLKAVASIFGWAQQRDSFENTKPMQANAAAQTDATATAKAVADVNNPNAADFEKDIQ